MISENFVKSILNCVQMYPLCSLFQIQEYSEWEIEDINEALNFLILNNEIIKKNNFYYLKDPEDIEKNYNSFEEFLPLALKTLRGEVLSASELAKRCSQIDSTICSEEKILKRIAKMIINGYIKPQQASNNGSLRMDYLVI